MPDYTISPPPNLRSVDCCANCLHVFIGWSYRCSKIPSDVPDAPPPVTVKPWNICDAFEREVRND